MIIADNAIYITVFSYNGTLSVAVAVWILEVSNNFDIINGYKQIKLTTAQILYSHLQNGKNYIIQISPKFVAHFSLPYLTYRHTHLSHSWHDYNNHTRNRKLGKIFEIKNAELVEGWIKFS
jgi:hypothetical protein